MLEGNGISNIVLWIGNLLITGALFFYVFIKGKWCFADMSGGQKGQRVSMFTAIDRFLEFAVYSAGMI